MAQCSPLDTHLLLLGTRRALAAGRPAWPGTPPTASTPTSRATPASRFSG